MASKKKIFFNLADEMRYSKFLTQTPDELFITDMDGIVLWVNHVKYFKMDEVIGKNAELLLKSESKLDWKQAFGKAKRTGKPVNIETVFKSNFCYLTHFIKLNSTEMMMQNVDITDVKKVKELQEQ